MSVTINNDQDQYRAFLESKRIAAPTVGLACDDSRLPAGMFAFQRDLTRWAMRKGRAALFATTGMGKTVMQLAWAEQAARRVLLLAPLAVAKQTILEAEKWGIKTTYARSEDQAPVKGIVVTNYEMLDKFDLNYYGAVVLDESGILKNFEGKVRTRLIKQCVRIPLRLCCTATPAPNDISEIANHAEFLGLMTRAEMLASFFVHDDSGWRLKGHAREPFYRWLASWGMSVSKPSDLGYSDEGFILPPLDIRASYVDCNWKPEGMLFATKLKGIQERSQVRRATVEARIDEVIRIVESEPDESWLMWCGLNDESGQLAHVLPDAVEVKGSDSIEHKENALLGFAAGEVKRLVTKAKIAGFGMNFQRCARMIFVGIGDSYETYFQAIRRCWRFGQTRPVDVHIVLSEGERPIYENVLRKEREAEQVQRELIKHVAEFERAEIATGKSRLQYQPAVKMTIPTFVR